MIEQSLTVSVGSSSGSAVTVRLPKEQVLTILSRAINEHASLADLLKFNVEHEQWDLIIQHLSTMAKHKTVIEACASALLPNTDSQTPRRLSNPASH